MIHPPPSGLGGSNTQEMKGASGAVKKKPQVLNEAGVVIVPGLDFGPATATSYVRLSYANSLENLQEAVARLKKFLAHR